MVKWFLWAGVGALFLLTTPARADCEVHGIASLTDLRVRMPGRRLRTLSTVNLPVSVRPGRGSRFRDVRVLAPLSFGARTDAQIQWTVARPEALADASVWLTSEVRIGHVRELDDDTLTLRAQVSDNVSIDRLRVPCNALAVGHGESGEEPPDWVPSRGPRWVARRSHLWLLSSRGHGARIRLTFQRPHATHWVEVERTGGWMRIAHRFPTGVVIRGWARTQHVSSAPARVSSSAHRAEPSRTEGAAESGNCPAGVRSQERLGQARIRTGTFVYGSPNGVIWATVSEPSLFTVAFRSRSDWVRIVHAIGLRSDRECPAVLRRAWVPRSAVTFQRAQRGEVPSSVLGIE